jgi:magnesium transporter
MQIPRRRPRRSPPSTVPGTITVDPTAEKPRIEVLSFGPDATPATIRVQALASIADLPALPPRHTIRWINVVGLGDAGVLAAIGRRFGIHPLTLEDIANTSQRPKLEPYDDYLFIVTRMPAGEPSTVQTLKPEGGEGEQTGSDARQLITEQLSICVGKDFVLTFQEHSGDAFGPLRQRFTSGTGRVRSRGPDYLAYAILDAAVDAFFPVLEGYGDGVDDLEAEVIESPSIHQITRIHDLKRNLLTARRAVWPQREMLNTLIRDETPFISSPTKLFLRDCYDHTIQLIDVIETYREIASGLVDVLLSSQSNRMNEIMKLLTIIATIFIPLSWVAAVYGMNFDTKSPWNLPELGWRYGYFFSLAVMFVMACGLLLWFWHRGWIGRPKQ